MEQMLMRGNELRAQALWNQWWDIFDPMLKNGGHQRAFNKQLIHLGGQIQAVSSPERSKNKQTSFPFLSWQLGQHVSFESIKKQKQKPPEVTRIRALDLCTENFILKFKGKRADCDANIRNVAWWQVLWKRRKMTRTKQKISNENKYS